MSTLFHVVNCCSSGDNDATSRSELARLLTSRAGTTVDLQGQGGLTPLHLAARGGWEKCAANLLENQASPVSRNHKGHVRMMR